MFGDVLVDLGVVLRELQRIPLLRDVATDQQIAGPTVRLEINRDAATRRGIPVQAIDDTLYDAFGQRKIVQFFTQQNKGRARAARQRPRSASASRRRRYRPVTRAGSAPAGRSRRRLAGGLVQSELPWAAKYSVTCFSVS
jgi:multidrug efflux pump subunit AcrB